MKKYFLFLLSIAFLIAPLYSMQNKSQELQIRFQQNKDHVAKLEKLQRHVKGLKPTTGLSQVDIQSHTNTLSNRIRYLKAQKKLKWLENLPHGPLSNITELKKVETLLQTTVKSGHGLEPQELTYLQKVLLPYTAILISTDQLFQSTKQSQVRKYLPLSEADVQKKFKPFDCLQRNARGDTILQHALKIKLPIYTLRYLLSCGQSANDTNHNKENAIHSAVLTDNSKALQTLLSCKYEQFSFTKDHGLESTEEPVEVNAQDSLGQTPLHKACILRLDNCVRILIAYRASVAVTDHRGKTAVEYLFDQPWAHVSTLICRELLATHKPDVLSSQHLDILEKIQKADEEKLREVTHEITEKLRSNLKEQHIKTSKKKTINKIPPQPTLPAKAYATRIFQALHEDTLTQSLLEHETNFIDIPNDRKETPLCWAIQHKPHYCTILLQQKANPNKTSRFVSTQGPKLTLTPLEHAAMLQGPLSSELMELLLKYNANPNVGATCPPLHCLAYTNDSEKIMLLLKYKAHIDLLFTGETALHAACKISAGKSIVTLLRNGADPNIISILDGKAALDYCYENKEPHFILLLLVHGARTFAKKIFLNDDEMDLTQPKNRNILQGLVLLYGSKIQVIFDKKGIHLKFP